MRLTHLHIENLFSFDHFELDLDADTTVLLGPNGSGKTNVFRALDLAATALRWVAEERASSGASPSPFGAADQSLRAYSAMSHRNHGGRRQVKLGLQFDQSDEVSLLVSFLRSVIAWSVRDELHGSSTDSPIEDWVDGEITPERVSCLTRGTLVIAHSSVPGRSWEVGYDFQLAPSGSPCRWILAAPQLRDCVVGLDGSGRLPNGPVPQSRGISQALLGLPAGPLPPHLDDPLPAIDLDRAIGSDPVGPITLGRQGGTAVDWSAPAVLDFLTRIGAPHPLPDHLWIPQGWSISHLIRRLWQEKLFAVGEQLRGIGRWGDPVTAVGSYDLDQLASAPRTSETPFLPARLFRLANGSAEERGRLEEIRSLFGQLTGGRHLAIRAIPLPSRPAPDPSGGGSTVPTKGAGGVLLELLVAEELSEDSVGALERPIQFWGAGIWEALVLAEALAGPPGRVVLLDEPAANLHPSWQQVLRGELTRGRADQRSGAPQIVVITHAPDLVPLTAEGGAAVIRISRRLGASHPSRVSPDLLSKAGKKLRAKGNQRVLFVDQVVLVEGEDDREVLRILARRCKLDLEGSGRALLDCGGRESLPDYIRLCKHLDIPHLVVMDGDATTASCDTGAFERRERVRDAVRGSESGTLFEFKEAIEQAFGFGLGEKGASRLREAAEGCSLGDNCAPELQALITTLEAFVQPVPTFPTRASRGGAAESLT
jgi:energy-coupling factor transporter ATP-binding protein EcfA2